MRASRRARSGVFTGEMGASERDADFKAFYDSEARRVRQLALFLVGDRELAADLTQEAFLRTFRHWNRIRKQDPGPYVRRALVNLCKNSHRRKAVEWRQRPVTREVHPTPDVEETMRVARALEDLPPVRRAVILLRFYEDMTAAQIARALDRPLGTVKSDIRRGLQQLKPLLGEQVGGRLDA
ncbi:MAG TPA: sigma-70 family RNA polymerase sigma factor [Actinomycetota bacterium]